MADAAILVLTSLPDPAAAQALARALVTGRLAACVSIGATAIAAASAVCAALVARGRHAAPVSAPIQSR